MKHSHTREDTTITTESKFLTKAWPTFVIVTAWGNWMNVEVSMAANSSAATHQAIMAHPAINRQQSSHRSNDSMWCIRTTINQGSWEIRGRIVQSRVTPTLLITAHRHICRPASQTDGNNLILQESTAKRSKRTKIMRASLRFPLSPTIQAREE